jgi:tRNA(fMet)-specific endonuclease VapC
MTFLDTNVIIDLMRGRKPWLEQRYHAERLAGTALAISTIVMLELRYGALRSTAIERSLQAIDVALGDKVRVVPFDAADAAEAAQIRAGLTSAGQLIGPYDVLIAAQARARGATLVTANTREFARVPGLTLTDWAA